MRRNGTWSALVRISAILLASLLAQTGEGRPTLASLSTDSKHAATASSTGCEWPGPRTEIRVTAHLAGTQAPTVAWNGSEFALAWADNRHGDWEIYFARFDASGIPIGTHNRLTDAPGLSLSPSLIWTGSEYSVAWMDDRDGYPRIWFVRLDSLGEKLLPEIGVTSFEVFNGDAAASTPSLIWTGQYYGVAWQEYDRPFVYFTSFDQFGDSVVSDRLIAAGRGPVDLVWTGSEFGMTFWDFSVEFPDSGMVHFGRFNAAGDLTAESPIVTNGDVIDPDFTGGSHARLVWTGTEYGIVWTADIDPVFHATYLSRVDNTGAPIGDPHLISGSGRWPAAQWDGSEYGVSSVQDGEIRFLRVDNAGNAIGQEVAITDAGGHATRPIALAWAGTQYGVAFRRTHYDGEESSGQGVQEVYFALVGCDECVDGDGDGFSTCEECDDTNSEVFPGAPAICDGLNNDCLNAQWPDIADTNEADDDLDGLSECDGDCDDSNPSVGPNTVETCNGIDDNCNTLIDEDDSGEDTDGDGVPNLCDNCPNESNSDQLESEAGNFGPQQVVSTTADRAWAVFGADVDGDGDIDVLSASYDDDKIAWYENLDGIGNFGSQQVISAVADRAWSVFGVDVDGDGDTDVLSASYDNDTIAWYQNLDGAGNFGPQQVVSTIADRAWSVFGVDVDGDGDTDVLSASFDDDKIAWYENLDGVGNFGPQQVISTLANGALSVFGADVDGDGDIDVLSASRFDGEIAWYENLDGAGNFGSQQVIFNTPADAARSVFGADVDGDGDIDVLSASYDDDRIAWYENLDGMGTFGPQRVVSAVARGARSVFGADVDGDGDIDVLSASCDDDKIAWYENLDGAGNFGSQQVVSTLTDCARSVFAADMDGDGDTDMISASILDGKIAWYRNDADGFGDVCDNCPYANNPDQLDLDADSAGDACDCDGSDGTVWPSAPQLCDGVNNDCDDLSWPTVPSNEIDHDGDAVAECVGDCDDTDDTVWPGAPQLCDGLNNDCSDPLWPDVPADEVDDDGDLFAECAGDCDDMDPDRSPGALETCNGIDDNCNVLVDEDELGEDTDSDGLPNLCDNCPEAYNLDQADIDEDSVGNACDNCLFVSNPLQEDLDADTRGDLCDNCPASVNLAQDDLDGDTVGDVCDNCIFDENLGQSDLDDDFEGDHCDLDDGLIYVQFYAGSNYVEWQPESGFDSWNLYKGDLSVLKGSGVYTQVPGSNLLAAQECGLADRWFEELSAPETGQSAFYLTAGVAAGVEGDLGTDSAGQLRPNTDSCP